MTKDEALRLALEALEDLARYEHPQTMIQIRKKDGGSIVTMYPHKVASDAITAIKAALEAKNEPMKKLQVTLEDRPVDIELAQYKRMFEAACSTLGAVSHALGCDPDEGGAEPLLAAIEELKGQTTPPQRTWVGLKDDDEIDWDGGDLKSFVKAIEAKLKAKNT